MCTLRMENQMEKKMGHEMDTAICLGIYKGYMSYCLNSMKGCYIGDYVGEYYRRY